MEKNIKGLDSTIYTQDPDGQGWTGTTPPEFMSDLERRDLLRLGELIDSLWEVSKNLVELVARICDQHPRLAHLALYAKKGRARKKNVHRLVAFMIEELKNETV